MRKTIATAAAVASALAVLAGPEQAGMAAASAGRAAPHRVGDDREAATWSAATALPRVAGVNRPDGHQGYPRRTDLRVYPENPADESIRLGLVPYHAIAPRLNHLQDLGERVSVEVVGESVAGRDLYLVTVTAPESAAEAAQQACWRHRLEDDPVAALRDPGLRAGYKAPIWVNGNIHGNEFEGTDGALRVIERLATSSDPAVTAMLGRSRVYFNVTANPDGRVVRRRGNAHGFDLNRDFVTASQPENRAMRKILIDTQPLMVLDEHGYVEGTLLEPTTPPHGQNYDFDLFIKHAYDNALGMERDLAGSEHPETRDPAIPFRDFAPGDWDDWAPIYTSQYSMYQGAISYTIEIPLEVNTGLPVDELRRRGRVNTDVVVTTIDSTLAYLDRHRDDLIANQAEIFRRGLAGEPLREVPDGFVPGFGPEDRYTTTFPRGYVIPAGRGQRSDTAAAHLVDHLVANDVRVRRAERPFALAGRHYPTGSYLVDMHQPKRALANAMLEAGRDISDRVPVMFDISGWSHALLWGATVDIAEGGWTGVPSLPVTAATPTGGVDAPAGRDLALSVRDGQDVRAVNDLLDHGVGVRRGTGGAVLVPAAARRAAATAARTHGVRFTAAPVGAGGTAMTRTVLAAAVASDELYGLRELGFDVRPVTPAALNDGFDWSAVDVLVVTTSFDVAALSPRSRHALDGFLTSGGVITRGVAGAAFNDALSLLPVRAVAGPAQANGVVAVHSEGGLFGAAATSHAFVSRPVWFTDVGPGVAVEQRFAAGDPLIAGHWRPSGTGSDGPSAAAGQAAVVSGTARTGATVVMFGTEPLFRHHPRGLFAQVAQAAFWTGNR
ncbi:M14 family zinc carboxypeptidase [Actinokineospora sp. 24-640]